MEFSAKSAEIISYMRKLFGAEPKCGLEYATDIDLLVASILSAQCTDKRVNIVTETLFKKYRTLHDYANANRNDLEREIYSCGFYRSKAANIIGMARMVLADFGGKIPADIDGLVKLCGVGRKIASVFLAEWHKLPAIAVDTHVIRVSGRLGLTRSKNPAVIERDLMRQIDKADWRLVNIYLVLFGRNYCRAQKPLCAECGVKKYCSLFK